MTSSHCGLKVRDLPGLYETPIKSIILALAILLIIGLQIQILGPAHDVQPNFPRHTDFDPVELTRDPSVARLFTIVGKENG